jgi:hypothetical protein
MQVFIRSHDATMTAASTAISALNTQGLGHTERRDAWWLEPVLTLGALAVFAVYGIWAAAQGNYYHWGPYLSPFYSPNLQAWFPALFGNLPFSPAFLVLWAPLGFRGTCYFYRRAYYRAAFADPPACAVGEPKACGGCYTGETKFPFVLQNMHRFFFYVAAILAVFHWTHVAEAFQFDGGPAGTKQFGVGIGTLVLLVDAILLSLYTFSCHSFRHLLAGKLDVFSSTPLSRFRHQAWVLQTKINAHHMFYAWTSLLAVAFADLYVRLVAMGIITDLRLV